MQMNDLSRADNFVTSLLSKDDTKAKPPVTEPLKIPQAPIAPLPFRTDNSPLFSEPPAPPPQQPLPEKPDAARSNPSDSPSLRRMNTERPRSVTNASPVREQNSSQIISLVEALASAKKEIDSQGAKLRDLEEMLQKERQAREMAEEVAKRLELESQVRLNGHAKGGNSFLDEAFEPTAELVAQNEKVVDPVVVPDHVVDPVAISDSSSLLEKKMESMLAEMMDLKGQMEAFKQRAETAEAERDADKKTLAEMVESIRAEESARKSASTERARSPSLTSSVGAVETETSDPAISTLDSLLEKVGSPASTAKTNGTANQPAVGTLSKPTSGRDPLLYNTTPYASMLGVVLVGMGLMAYLNGWQHAPKVDG